MSTKKTPIAEVAQGATTATATANEIAVCGKVTTIEEIWTGHEKLPRTEDGFILLSDEKVRNFAASHKYAYREGNKLHKFVILSKRSGTEKGGKTLYDGTLNGEAFKEWSIEDIKRAIGCDYRRAKNGSNSSSSALAKCKYATDKLSELVEATKDEEIAKAYNQLKGLVSLKRAEEVKKLDAEKEARDAAEKEARKVERAKETLKALPEAMLKALFKEFGL